MTARLHYERARAIYQRRLGPDHSGATTASFNLGLLHARLGDVHEARREFEMVIATWERLLGPDHPFVELFRHLPTSWPTRVSIPKRRDISNELWLFANARWVPITLMSPGFSHQGPRVSPGSGTSSARQRWPHGPCRSATYQAHNRASLAH